MTNLTLTKMSKTPNWFMLILMLVLLVFSSVNAYSKIELENLVKLQWTFDEEKRVASVFFTEFEFDSYKDNDYLPEGAHLDFSCYKPEDDTIVGKVRHNEKFIFVMRSEKSGKVIGEWRTDKHTGGTLMFSDQIDKMAKIQDWVVQIRFKNNKWLHSNLFLIKDAGNMIGQLKQACLTAPPQVIWAHGNSCPAGNKLVEKYSGKDLFSYGHISSAELKFTPTRGTGSWCQKNAHITFAGPYRITHQGLHKIQDHFREFGCAIKKLCPQMETLAYSQFQSQITTRYAMASWRSNFAPLTDKDFAALQTGPVTQCDHFATHPKDPMRQQELSGVSEKDMDVKQALEACAELVSKDPENARAQFQFGRALLMDGQFKKAFNAFKKSADDNYAMGMLYLGHAYANAWGTKEDFKQANIYWSKGSNAGGSDGDSREIELAVAVATNSKARIICDWQDEECERKARRPQYISSMTSEQRKFIKMTFPDIHTDMRRIYGGFYSADFEGLQLLKYDILDQGTSKNTIIGHLSPLLPGIKESMELKTERSRFEPVIAQYALIKTNLMGACGEPIRKFEVTHSVNETWRNGYGVEISKITRETGKSYFHVPTRFATLVEQTDTTEVWAPYASGLKKFLSRTGGCGSEVLKVLEKNMFAYLSWTPKAR